MISAAIGVIALVLLAGSVSAAEPEPDPGGFNAWAHEFNRDFAANVVAPVLDAGRALPDPMPAALGNAFANLTEPVSAVSQLMMGEVGEAARSSARFAINSTVGLFGAIDVADAAGLPMHKTYFSEGVCALGLPMTDDYLVVPGVGASSVGTAGSAVALMVGSTWILSFVAIELAVASIVADLAASAAALENAAAAADGPGDPVQEERAYRAYLARIGC